MVHERKVEWSERVNRTEDDKPMKIAKERDGSAIGRRGIDRPRRR
jgi:hypothetical protein